ncbi:MAG: hydrogenase maturation protease [Gemmatimonadaceae bacterium]|nr:hydrogenase maturation protease [Gemmatimonadaceae bacterium]MDQ3517409.1 hydrogenase maturation protease [Gemmatimonadota bacterium]
MSRTLIAGFGNTLRGDDGFGVEVVRRLGDKGVATHGVDLMEVGTAGIRLAQELLTPCDLLIIADAMNRGGEPGTVYVLEVDFVEQVERVDMHVAIPSHALSVAQALNVLPPRVILVGCEPMQVDEMTCDLTGELTPPVRAAVDVAVQHIHRLLAGGPSAATVP